MATIRSLEWPDDAQALVGLDTSFQSGHVFRIVVSNDTAALIEIVADPPIRKRYPLAEQLDDVGALDWVQVAVDGDAVVGMAGVRWSHWNRRAELEHLYVAPSARNRGLGRALVAGASAAARAVGSRVLWAETQTTNVAAVHLYERLGFSWCGFDASLYDPDQVAVGEVALFYALDLGQTARAQ